MKYILTSTPEDSLVCWNKQILLILRDKGTLEVSHAGDHRVDLVFGREERGANVVRSVLLVESASGNRYNSSVLQKLFAIEVIRSDATLLCRLHRLLWQQDFEEDVHGSIHRLTGDTGKTAKGVTQTNGTSLQTVQNRLTLFGKQGVRRLSRLGRIDHDVDGDLTVQIGA